MNLSCLNDIITKNLAIHVDLSDNNSWNLNTGLTVTSLTKWYNAKSDNILLHDWGLTSFDVGNTNKPWDKLEISPDDTHINLYPVGYNIVNNPTTGQTSGLTINTLYLDLSGVTSNTHGNYFELNDGYLQGFFKLKDYNYELLPSRYNNGITIETLLYLYPESNGIFFTMGTRAEDKYNPHFSGETTINNNEINGVFTSENNYLDAIKEKERLKNAFGSYEEKNEIIQEKFSQSANTKNNLIAFEITNSKKITCKCIDVNNLLSVKESNKTIDNITGWTIISIIYTPDEIIEDLDLLSCYKQRNGKLSIYINGRLFWSLNDFPEFYFHSFSNDKEKQIGVPYSISWGGGSFGLQHSWHYDKQTYRIYNGENTTFIDDNFIIESNPFPDECDSISGETILDGILLSANSTTFKRVDNCDSTIQYPITTMEMIYTGITTGLTSNTYFIKFNNPISILSNREYDVNLNMYVDNFFKSHDANNYPINNKISLLIYGTEDVYVIEDIEYKYPINSGDINNLSNIEIHPFDDELEYEYVKNGISYYGVSGLPVGKVDDYYSYTKVNEINNQVINTSIITGNNKWLKLKSKFKVKDNTGQQFVYIGLLIETSNEFNLNGTIYIDNFTYTGADILSQDSSKNNLLIEQNFNSSFNGKIQKLRIYDNALNSQEILHNALIEKKKNQNLNLNITKGGRIIYK